MKSLSDLPAVSLEWRTSGGPDSGYELVSNQDRVASLTFLDDAQDLARIETAEGTWTFKHAGLLNAVVTLREEGSHSDLAIFHPHAFRHGKLEFADGAVYDWVALPGKEDGTESGGAFLDEQGAPLLRLHAQALMAGKAPAQPHQGTVELGTPSQARWRYALLASLGWYLLTTEHLRGHQVVAAETCLRL